MLSLPLLLLQLAAADSLAAADADSSPERYSSVALEATVARASAQNRFIPRGLGSYRARMQTELGVLLRRPEGGELVVQVEQVENELRWRRPGSYEQRVVGVRAQAMGVNLSLANGWRTGWAVPILYGNRIALMFGRRDTSRLDAKTRERIARRRQERPVYAVHPFAGDRERYYRFTGGDTIAVVRVRGRDIPLVRVAVEPLTTFEIWDSTASSAASTPPSRVDSAWSVVLFRGELAVDASRGHLVRMRGTFVEVQGKKQRAQKTERVRGRGGLRQRVLTRVLTAGLQAIAYVELENAEVEERYWLPSYQRLEAQMTAPVMGDQKAIYRLISRFRGYTLNDTASTAADTARLVHATDSAAVGDTVVAQVHRLVWAPSDSISRYAGWSTPIGREVSAASAEDFDDIAPDIWRPTGPPRLDFRVQRFADLVHFNRVEGLYTGYGAVLRLRDAAPGVTLAANVGYAWSEQTVRGRIAADRLRDGWLTGLRAGRSLDITNDFRLPMDSGSSLAALFGMDNYDYVDRRSATVVVARQLGDRVGSAGRFGGGGGTGGGVVLRLETGLGADRQAVRRLTRGLFRTDSGFRENRGVMEGSYWRTALSAELHPAVNGDFMRPGFGAVVAYERADGVRLGGDDPLGWQRVEGRALLRREWGPLIYAARADAGAVFGAGGAPPPPQQLFELGEGQRLPGYGYKEFAGDRAAVARAYAMYGLPYFRAPLRLGHRFTFPAPAPALSVGVQSGWASTANRASAARSLELLGTVPDPATGLPTPISRPTYGVRTSVDLMVRLFGGALGIGVARPVDHPAPWRFVVSGGQML